MRNSALSAGLVILLAALGAAAGEPAPALKVFVLDLAAQGVPEALARTVADAALEGLQARPELRVMGRSEMGVLLEHQQGRQLLGCQEADCLADLGQALQADRLVSGTVGMLGATYLLSLQLLDPRAAVVLARSSATAFSPEELAAAARRAAVELFGPAAAEVPATAFALQLAPGGTLKAAVLELKAVGVPEDQARNLTQVVVQELKRSQGLALISRDEIAAMLSFKEDKARLGCDDDACLSEIGGALGVDYLVSGSVGQLGETRLVHLKLIDMRETRVVNRVAESFQGDAAQLLGATRAAARRLIGRGADDPGLLEVRPSVEDARLLVGGEELERDGPRSVPAGKLRLRVEADDHLPWVGDLYVEPGELTRFDVTLEEVAAPWYESWWLWTAVGALVLTGAGLGVYYGLFAEDPTGTLMVTSAVPGGGR
ncbi:MAG TPA: hypothetical protein PK668_08140 [Myxococcota bacterium]|nr:hypothetical protein [Myxococcota bacterium]HRY93055.1 hypothetical protein [Myxococcota bacterium]HSA21590.1 hypothetical protein [Myxococcota bacterium]